MASTVILIGAGIVNLVTAHALVQAGFSVTLFDRAPDPQKPFDFRQHGSTFGGSDARIFSLNEGRHHFLEGPTGAFERSIQDGGWLVLPAEERTSTDLAWIGRADSVTPGKAAGINRELLGSHRESLVLWRRLMTTSPELFEAAGLCENVLRPYPTEEKLKAGRQSEAALGSLLRELTPEQVAAELPVLREAVHRGNLAGALQVVGFSLHVHKLGWALLRSLEKAGAAIHWSTPVHDVVRDEAGAVAGVRVEGQVLSAEHYVLSTGSTGSRLHQGLVSEGQIAPVVGCWLTLRAEGCPLEKPLKLSRTGYAAEGAADQANIIPGKDSEGNPVIHVSTGHGYVGLDSSEVSETHLAELSKIVHETAAVLFPSEYEEQQKEGSLPKVERYCARPWTATGRGVFEVVKARGSGKLVVTGGHGTGGFALAPWVAQAVRETLQERKPSS